MTIQELESTIRQAWAKRTDDYSQELLKADEPSAGQCAVTALVVQDYFGGEIVNTIATSPHNPVVSCSHYFNIIDECEIDLTKQQFIDGVKFSKAEPKTKGFSSTRDYMLSYPATAERYLVLKSRVVVPLGA